MRGDRCHALTPGMIERRWGRIMRIGSVDARAGRTNRVAYSTAKAGLPGPTRSLARELGPYGICVHTVLPGAIQSEAENAPTRHRAWPEGQVKRRCVPRRGRPRALGADGRDTDVAGTGVPRRAEPPLGIGVSEGVVDRFETGERGACPPGWSPCRSPTWSHDGPWR
ncbi:SDR family NAD(P)-dependent oxidoreductase [Streptomyces sp. KL110A]|uniref:SDR family NAD(P)-dependent oxidoreductase n=1 Tax=Streptomyces sp. KL110A TaxID=3384221 RepID=UPI0038CA6237